MGYLDAFTFRLPIEYEALPPAIIFFKYCHENTNHISMKTTHLIDCTLSMSCPGSTGGDQCFYPSLCAPGREDPVWLRVRDQCYRLPGHVLPAEPHEHDRRVFWLRLQRPGLLPASHDPPLQLRRALLLTVSSSRVT